MPIIKEFQNIRRYEKTKLALSAAALFALSSCLHGGVKTRAGDVAELTPVPARYKINLETLLTEPNAVKTQLNLNESGALSLSQLAELKAQLNESRTENTKSQSSVSGAADEVRLSPKNLLSSVKKSDYRQLSKVALDPLIRVLAKIKEDEAYGLARRALAESACQAPPALTMAYATWAERGFPKTEFVDLSLSLYKKTYSCAGGELQARAAYRLGLFELAQQNCQASLPYWDVVSRTPEVKYLFSRAEYWKNHCAPRAATAGTRSIAMDFYQQFPLSYHTIQVFKDSNESLSGYVMNKNETPVQVRTEKDAAVNRLLEQIELALANSERPQAEEYLRWLTDRRIEALEPQVRLYLGYLSFRAQDGLGAFQILSRTMSQYPQLKTPATLRIFYPLWHYEQIEKEASKHGLDPLLVASLIRQESAFNAQAVSRVGARGLMQLMPRTARSLERGLKLHQLNQPEKNIELGTKYFAGLVRRYDGNVALALAAYNAGFGAVDKWRGRYQVSNQLLFADLIPYRETREYVGSILRNYYWYQNLQKHESEAGVRDLIGLMPLEQKKYNYVLAR